MSRGALLLALAGLGCGAGEASLEPEPGFEDWLDAALARCHPAATRDVHCVEGRCVAIIRTASGAEEPDLKGCMAWPYVGMGRQKRTLECGEATYRLTAVSQLPPMDAASSGEVLEAEAAFVSGLVEAVQCP